MDKDAHFLIFTSKYDNNNISVVRMVI